MRTPLAQHSIVAGLARLTLTLGASTVMAQEGPPPALRAGALTDAIAVDDRLDGQTLASDRARVRPRRGV